MAASPAGGAPPWCRRFCAARLARLQNSKVARAKSAAKASSARPQGAASEKGKHHAAAFSMPKIAPPGAILQSARALFSRRATPPRGSNGRSLARDPPDSSCGGSAVASRVGLLRRPPFPWIAYGALENSRPWDFLGRFSGLTRPEKTPSKPFRKSQGRKKNSRKKCYVKAPRHSTTPLLT